MKMTANLEAKNGGGISSYDPLTDQIITRLKGGNEQNAIRMVAAIMLDEIYPRKIIAFRNKETGLYELLGGKINNDDTHSKFSLDREIDEELKPILRRSLDDNFHKKLGISPVVIGDLFGEFPFSDKKRIGDSVQQIKRLCYVFYVNDYGELPEKTLQKKYDKPERIFFPEYFNRNDLSVLTHMVCENLVHRVRCKGVRLL